MSETDLELSYDEQLARIRDRRPAHERGLTLREACTVLGRPPRVVRQAFVAGLGPMSPPIGRRDHWDVWWADPADLAALFGGEEHCVPVAVQRTRRKAEALRAKLRSGR